MPRLSPDFFHANDLPQTHRLIETGTGAGMTPRRCRKLFAEIHTIEWDGPTYAQASKDLAFIENITCHLGWSPNILPLVIDPRISTTFYLDAHFVGSNPVLKAPPKQCPVLDELQVIFSYSWPALPLVIIDDARIFQRKWWNFVAAKPYDRAQWPSVEQLDAAFPAGKYSRKQSGDVFIYLPAA